MNEFLGSGKKGSRASSKESRSKSPKDKDKKRDKSGSPKRSASGKKVDSARKGSRGKCLSFPCIFRSTFVGSAWSFVFFIPATMANNLRLRRNFYPRFYTLHLFSYLNSWERASIFPFECSVLNKGTTGTIFKINKDCIHE